MRYPWPYARDARQGIVMKKARANTMNYHASYLQCKLILILHQ